MNIFEQYGIRDIADCTLYAIELDENDDEIYIPFLYMDTLKVSTVEESNSQVHAEGGIGNPKLITWDYGKDITISLEDALYTPASQSMNWGGHIKPKKLQLYLQYLFDRNTDNGTPDTCLRTAKLTVDKIDDFMIIPDRWCDYTKDLCPCDDNYEVKKHDGYVGGTSIYCWEIDGYIISDDNTKRITIEKLLLFYREQKQKWYFFNGYKFIDDKDDYDIKKYGIGFQYGDDVFQWIKDNLQGELNGEEWKEYEPVALATWGNFERDEEFEGVPFLTQNLYIDGYRPNCERQWKYSEIDASGDTSEIDAIRDKTYLPYRYFANIGVEYNTNITPPQGVAFDIETAYDDIELIEHEEKPIAYCNFCIDTDVNLKHSQFRLLKKYDLTELTVYIDPKTMMPYQPNTFEYYRKNGQRITGNLRVIKQGEPYIKWTREKAKTHNVLAKELVIDAKHYPGTFRLVGNTVAKDRYGIEHKYMFEVPLCKLHADNKLTLQASGDPTTFSIKLTALRRFDGVMMKLVEYDFDRKKYHGYQSNSLEALDYLNPDITLNPQSFEMKDGVHIDGTVEGGVGE